jgi:hypothetical protein
VNLSLTSKGARVVGPWPGPNTKASRVQGDSLNGVARIVDIRMIQTLTGLRSSATLCYAWLLKKRSS